MITGLTQAVSVTVYSFLVAFILPTPSETVLFSAPDLPVHLTVFISAAGKTAGSFVAYYFARRLLKTNVIQKKLLRWLKLERWEERIENHTLRFIQRTGHLGLFFCLAIPGLPDTISVYAFSLVKINKLWFLILVFLGSLSRLYLVLWGLKNVFQIMDIPFWF